MIENIENKKTDKDENPKTKEESTKDFAQKEQIKIPIKFNKEVKELSLNEASNLAQKGMKFDIIYADYEKIKALAGLENKSVSEYINNLVSMKRNQRVEDLAKILGGNKEMAEHVISLEDKDSPHESTNLDEVKEYFPQIKELDDLPKTVLESVKLKGTNLLDEYLRFLLNKKRSEEEIVENQKKVKGLSLGSQINCAQGESPETSEFLKGLWK